MIRQKGLVISSVLAFFLLASVIHTRQAFHPLKKKKLKLEITQKSSFAKDHDEAPSLKRKYKAKALPILISQIPETNFLRDFKFRSFFIKQTVNTAFDALKQVQNKRGPPAC